MRSVIFVMELDSSIAVEQCKVRKIFFIKNTASTRLRVGWGNGIGNRPWNDSETMPLARILSNVVAEHEIRNDINL